MSRLSDGIREFLVSRIFFVNLNSKNECKNKFQDNNEMLMQTHSKIGFPQKIDFRADETNEFHPTAWELISNFKNNCREIKGEKG